MALKLYDLAGADAALRFSPHCWRVRMALAHKGLEVEALPWRFTDKDDIAFSGQGSVPVLVDGERSVVDSWEIALYLDETYPDKPLFGCPAAQGHAFFVKHWCERVLHPGVMKVIILDLFEILHEKDRSYFRKTREKRFGMTLEAFAADPDSFLPDFRKSLVPLRATVEAQDFIGGDAPSYADYIVFGAFQWARCASPIELLEAGDPVHAWRGRMLELHGGLAAKVPATTR